MVDCLHLWPFESKVKLALIAAVGQNRGIGLNQALPWHLPDDFAYFKQKTEHHLLIMGRQTFQSLPGVLPNRQHLVISSQLSQLQGANYMCSSIEQALEVAKAHKPANTEWVFGIGGERIFTELLPFADRLYLTEVAAAPASDRFFPKFSRHLWHESVREHHPQDARHAYPFDYVIYVRKQ